MRLFFQILRTPWNCKEGRFVTNPSNAPFFQRTEELPRRHAAYRTTSPSMLCKALAAPVHHHRYGPHQWSLGRKAQPAAVRQADTCSWIVSAGHGPGACALGGGVRPERPTVASAWLQRLTAAVPRAPRAGRCGASRPRCAQPWRPQVTARGGGKEGAGLGIRRNRRARPETTWPP